MNEIKELVDRLPVMVEDVKLAYTEKAVAKYDNVLLENLHLLVDDLPALPSIMLKVDTPADFWEDIGVQNSKCEWKLFIYADRENGVYKYVTHNTSINTYRKNGNMPCFARYSLSAKEKVALLKHWKYIKEHTISALQYTDRMEAYEMCKRADKAHSTSKAVDAWEF